MVNVVGLVCGGSAVLLIATVLIANRGSSTSEMSAVTVVFLRVLAVIVLVTLVSWLVMFRSAF
ncbi:hypothetical protein GCM10010472_68600 [Pseudonocardia halophobica]|uniref:Uncharacterized protein n=1 Tax=Pseudonocardia halophobica TaxID=29401 RepID=A0A9W6L2S2_9PSEU|nr:hypothetical protein [Pseudonocardia halophobica]GLL12571.1 hypothetical protein GCM10017577_37120 [Pseudonocardia halophobica]